MKTNRILVVDDEPGMCEVCSDSLQGVDGLQIETETDPTRAVERIRDEPYDLLLTDIRMPGLSGTDVLEAGRSADPDLPVIMITAFPTVDSAVECMKRGAVDYITKPFHPEHLVATVRRALEERRLREENSVLRRQVERGYAFNDIVGESASLDQVLDTIRRVADSDVDVLVHGETGTGKELIARSIHKLSNRANGRFVPVDSGAIPDALLESELFGHERGAFTGANSRSLGLMEYADGGTFFLDEIAELPLAMQAKLLRALQERKIRRVGGTEEIPIDIRVIAASSRDLEEMVREGRFREDLLYRINVVRVDLPPLRERRDDIPLLAEHFVKKTCEDSGRKVERVADEAMVALESYPWPGNIRELQNVIRRGVAMTRECCIGLGDLPDKVADAAKANGGRPLRGFFDEREQRVRTFEREYFARLLRRHDGDVTAAALDAKVPRGTLYRLLKENDMRASDFRASVEN